MDARKLNELKGEFIEQVDYATQVTQQYERGEVKYEKVSQELNHLHTIANQINIALGDAIRDIYQKGKTIHEKRRKQNIEQLGFSQ